MNKDSLELLSNRIMSTKKVLIVQADNPDADSLGSALGLSEVLNELNIENQLYCAVDIPGYLKYMTGWSLVDSELPANFDLIVIVDASAASLLEYVKKDKNFSKFVKSEKIILDHHATTNNDIKSTLCINIPDLSSTSELVYKISKSLEWPININCAEYLLSGILGDTQGLSNNLAKPDTFRAVAELLDKGVNRDQLELRRREYSKYAPEIYKYKADLIEKTKFELSGKLAIVRIDQDEMIKFSPLYNPSALILPDILQTIGVLIAVVIKVYDDGKITGTIRATTDFPYAAKIAEELGGGGHDYASGFKVTGDKDYDIITKDIINKTGYYINETS